MKTIARRSWHFSECERDYIERYEIRKWKISIFVYLTNEYVPVWYFEVFFYEKNENFYEKSENYSMLHRFTFDIAYK